MSVDLRNFELRARPRSVFAKIFEAPRKYYFVRKSYRGAPGSRLHTLPNISLAEAKHFLLHDRHGRMLLREAGTDIDTLANHLIEASRQQSADAGPDAGQDDADEAVDFDEADGPEEITGIE